MKKIILQPSKFLKAAVISLLQKNPTNLSMLMGLKNK
jgi:hypothetical protein